MIYVLQVTTGKEDVVKKRLEELGYICYVPHGFRYRRSKGIWQEIIEIIFKSYVFVEMEYTAENYYKICDIDHVLRFLRADGQPLILSYLEEEWIKLLAIMGETPCVVEMKEDEYTIQSGVLKNFETKIVKIDKHKKTAYFEIDVLGNIHKIALGIDIV